MATVVVLTGMVSYRDLNVAAPVALALDKYPGLRWLGVPVKLGAILGMTSTMLVMTVGQARIFMSMARDGLLPPWFSRIHPQVQDPANGTWVTGLAAAIIGGLLPVRILGELVSIGTLLAFITVCVGVLYLRRSAAGPAAPVQGSRGPSSPASAARWPARRMILALPPRYLDPPLRVDGDRLPDLRILRPPLQPPEARSSLNRLRIRRPGARPDRRQHPHMAGVRLRSLS